MLSLPTVFFYNVVTYIEIDSCLPNIKNEREGKMTKSIENELLDGFCFFMPAYQLVLVLHSLLYKFHQ